MAVNSSLKGDTKSCVKAVSVEQRLNTLVNTSSASSGGTPSVLYVSSNGNNTNSGQTWTSAKATLSGAFSALPSSGGLIYISAGTFPFSTAVTIPASGNITVKGTGSYLTILQNTTGHDLFTVSANSGSTVNWEDICFQANTGGHIFNANNCSVALWRWDRCLFQQSDRGKSIWYQPDGTFIGCAITHCQAQHVLGATIAAWYLQSSLGGISGNIWEDYWHTYSGTYVVDIGSTSASTYSQNNRFVNWTAETCVGGLVRLRTDRYSRISNILSFDNTVGSPGPTVKDMVYVGAGAGGIASWGTIIESVVRMDGLLGSGLVDIRLQAGKVGRSIVRGCGGSIDLGTNDVLIESLLTATVGTSVTNFSAVQSVWVDPVLSGITSPSFTTGNPNTLTPAFANNIAAQLSDTSRDYMLYFQIGTSGTAFSLKIGPTSGVTTTIMSGAVVSSGQQVHVRVPAGWFVKWTATSATLAFQKAVGC